MREVRADGDGEEVDQDLRQGKKSPGRRSKRKHPEGKAHASLSTAAG